MTQPQPDTTADPVKLAQLSQDLVVISGDVRDGIKAAREPALIDQSAWGNTQGSTDLSAAYHEAFEKGGLAVDDLAEVLEGDIDRTLLMAFSYQQTDEDNAAKVRLPNNKPIP